jgi:hypothetical protein
MVALSMLCLVFHASLIIIAWEHEFDTHWMESRSEEGPDCAIEKGTSRFLSLLLRGYVEEA